MISNKKIYVGPIETENYERFQEFVKIKQPIELSRYGWNIDYDD